VDDLRGKVVVAQFWTYTCINWLRTLAYVRAWAEKYRDRGLVVVGVHTPEFPFEQNVDNVRQAAEQMNVWYPIALDSDYKVWRAFSNRYWPAIYIADAEGTIRHHQFGEGSYDECERGIQQLLGEAGADGIADDLVSPLRPGSRRRPIGRICVRPRRISVTHRPRTSRPETAPESARRPPTKCLRC
jgi:thiol-disulfide isomerase/thioredoxin